MGWNGSNTRATGARSASAGKGSAGGGAVRPRQYGLIIGAVLVLAVIGGAVWWLTRGEAPQAPVDAPVIKHKAPTKPVVLPSHKVSSNKKTKSSVPIHISTNSPKWEAAKGLDPSLFPYTDGRKVIRTRTNNWDQIVDTCIMPNGNTRKVIRKATPQTFEHVTDQLIAMALSGANDVESTPIPIDDGMEPEFLRSLQTPILIEDTDSDAVKQMKQNVIEARKVIQEEMRNGRSFKEILSSHLDQRKENAALRADAMAAVRELKKEGDPKMLNNYVEKVNELLRSKGSPEISAPLTKAERRALHYKSTH